MYHTNMNLSENIIAAYREHPTLYTVAKKCNCTRDVARRVLLDAGLISSPHAEEVRTLLSAGLPPAEIAERLGCTVSTVYHYAPYIRGCHADYVPTANALRIRKHRIRKQNQAKMSKL